MASFIKEVNPQLAKRPLKTNGHLANLELTSLLKEATGVHLSPGRPNTHILQIYMYLQSLKYFNHPTQKHPHFFDYIIIIDDILLHSTGGVLLENANDIYH